MIYEVRYAEAAVRDLTEATDYIDHVLLNPDAADHLLDTLDRETQHLSDFPYAHAIIDDPYLKAQGIRFISIGNYLAFYIVDEYKHIVYIIRFHYGKRDWISVLKTGYSPR